MTKRKWEQEEKIIHDTIPNIKQLPKIQEWELLLNLNWKLKPFYEIVNKGKDKTIKRTAQEIINVRQDNIYKLEKRLKAINKKTWLNKQTREWYQILAIDRYQKIEKIIEEIAHSIAVSYYVNTEIF